jgi:sporulation protein YlmC with PRC-barrel domain
MKIKFAAATAVAAFMGGILLAGAANAESAKVTFLTGPGAGSVLVNSLLGDEVRNAAGEKLGKIDDLGFDNNGRISTAVIGVGGVLGIGEKYVAVPFGALTVETAGGKTVFKLDTTKEALKAAPQFEYPKDSEGMKQKLNEKLREWGAITKEKAAEYGEKAKEYGEKAKEKATEYGEKAKEKAGEAYDKAKDAVGEGGKGGGN